MHQASWHIDKVEYMTFASNFARKREGKAESHTHGNTETIVAARRYLRSWVYQLARRPHALHVLHRGSCAFRRLLRTPRERYSPFDHMEQNPLKRDIIRHGLVTSNAAKIDALSTIDGPTILRVIRSPVRFRALCAPVTSYSERHGVRLRRCSREVH